VGGGGLLKAYYNGSVYHLLAKVHPDFDWLPWKFVHTPKGIWRENTNSKKFLDWVAKQLGVQEYSDWYRVTLRVFNLIRYPKIKGCFGIGWRKFAQNNSIFT
jgi:hypothetical protein